MVCYKFDYKEAVSGEIPVQAIFVPTGSNIILGIGNNQDTEATITLVDDDTQESAGTVISDSGGVIPYYKLFQIITSAERGVKNYTATVSGTIDETAYTHTIKIQVIANVVSFGTIS